MIPIVDVEKFLAEFKQKLKVYNVFFKYRDKNQQTLYDLEITPTDRENYLLNLQPTDYSSGPVPDAYDPESPPNFEFGLKIKGKEVYIKINLGKPQKRVMCISFHIAEQKMKYPLKKKRDSL